MQLTTTRTEAKKTKRMLRESVLIFMLLSLARNPSGVVGSISVQPQVVPADTRLHAFLLQSEDPDFRFTWHDRVTCRHVLSGAVRGCGYSEILGADDEGDPRPSAALFMRGTGGYRVSPQRIKSIVEPAFVFPGFEALRPQASPEFPDIAVPIYAGLMSIRIEKQQQPSKYREVTIMTYFGTMARQPPLPLVQHPMPFRSEAEGVIETLKRGARQEIAGKLEAVNFRTDKPCSERNAIVITSFPDTGFGVVAEHLAWVLYSRSYREELTVVLGEGVKNWKYFSGIGGDPAASHTVEDVWSRLFQPLSNCRESDVTPRYTQHMALEQVSGQVHSFGDYNRVFRYRRYGYQWVFGQFSRWAFRPSEHLRRFLTREKEQLRWDHAGAGMIGVQIRQGERGKRRLGNTNDNMPLWHWNDLVPLLIDVSRATGLRRVYLATDSPDLAREALPFYENGTAAGLTGLEIVGPRPDQIPDNGDDCLRELGCSSNPTTQLYRMLRDLYLLSETKVMVGTLSSAFTMLASRLQAAGQHNISSPISIE